MATINIDTTLDVVENQKELAAALMGEDAITARKTNDDDSAAYIYI